jgi:hypothetical protein
VEWISVKDRLPEHETRVHIYLKEKTAWYDVMYGAYESDVQPTFYDDRTDSIIMLDEVTHWMPLPEPPND